VRHWSAFTITAERQGAREPFGDSPAALLTGRTSGLVRSQETPMQAVKGISMEKWLCWISMGVAGLLFLLFLLDFFLSFPFSGVSPLIDILGIITSALVFYLGYDAYKDLR
jgi:hypothetical protein